MSTGPDRLRDALVPHVELKNLKDEAITNRSPEEGHNITPQALLHFKYLPTLNSACKYVLNYTPVGFMHLGSHSAKETLKSRHPGLSAPSSVAVAAVCQRCRGLPAQAARSGRATAAGREHEVPRTHESCVPLCMIAGIGAIASGQAQTYALRVGCNVAVDGDRSSSSLGTTGATALLRAVALVHMRRWACAAIQPTLGTTDQWRLSKWKPCARVY
ncbi:hypothetical protein C8R45DRAFT_940809 [Mycena sanguinolenta]|nr:hypothetical protein C8R45DRAFT_940809 [Mycena sanguinolenta]